MDPKLFPQEKKTCSAKQEEDFEKFTLTSGCLTSCSSVLLASWNRWLWAIMKQFWQYPSSIVLPRVPQSRRWQDTVLRKPAAELPVWSAAEDFLWDLLWWRSKTLSVKQSMNRSSFNESNRYDDPKQIKKALHLKNENKLKISTSLKHGFFTILRLPQLVHLSSCYVHKHANVPWFSCNFLKQKISEKIVLSGRPRSHWSQDEFHLWLHFDCQPLICDLPISASPISVTSDNWSTVVQSIRGKSALYFLVSWSILHIPQSEGKRISLWAMLENKVLQAGPEVP